MKMVKSLLLGSAAGVVALSGAQAADLPVKAKPAQYVKICSLYGAGFYYIPGTDTCIKVGGWVRQEVGYGYNGSFSNQWIEMNQNNALTNNINWRTKGTLTIDARDQTEYGTLRSYMALGVSNNHGRNGGAIAGNYFNRWFIQWAGFTFGHAVSAFDGWFIAAKYSYGPIALGDTGDGGYDTITYTAQFGNGFSASIAVEPARSLRILNVGSGTGPSVALSTIGSAAGYGGANAPDVVGNLRVDQAWGSAQVSAAWHLVDPGYYTAANQASGSPSEKSGWAVAAGATLKMPWTGPKDELAFGGVYTVGASGYANAGPWQGDHVKFDGASGPAFPGSVGYGRNADAIMGGSLLAGTASGLELVKNYGVGVAYKHDWAGTPFTSRVDFEYIWYDYNGLGNAMLCTAQGFGAGGVGINAVAAAGCNNDYSHWGIAHELRWNVTPNFYMGLQVVYNVLNSADTPAGTATMGAVGARTAGSVYTVDDQDQWQLRFRVQRNFYP